MSSLIGDGFDSTPLTGQRGANLFKIPGKHKIQLVALHETKRNPGVGVDAVLIASNSGRLPANASVGWPQMKGKFPEYFYSALKRIIGYGLGRKPEEIMQKHVVAVLSRKGEPVKGKIIVIETTPKDDKGFSNINILGGADLEVTHKEPAAGAEYEPSEDDNHEAAASDGATGGSAEDPLGDLGV